MMKKKIKDDLSAPQIEILEVNAFNLGVNFRAKQDVESY